MREILLTHSGLKTFLNKSIFMNNYNLHFTPFLDCFIKYLYERWHGNKNTHIYSSLKSYLSTQSILQTKPLKCFTMCYSLFSNGLGSDYKG